MDCGANTADRGFKFTTTECVCHLTSYIQFNTDYETIFAEHRAISLFGDTLKDRVFARHPHILLQLRTYIEEEFENLRSNLKMVFGDHEVPCMRRHQQTSL